MKKKIIIGIILMLLLVLLFLLFMNKQPKDKLVGTWTTDGVTIYKFNNNNSGALMVSSKEYKFKYKINKDRLFIDFENERSTDSEYTYSFESGKLILEGDNGSFTFIRK